MSARWIASTFAAICVLAVGVFAQVTAPIYPYPKPKPTTGNTPPDYVRFSQTAVPSAYGNEQPIIWAVDVAGGLQSRLNSADRMAVNTNWNVEGSIVYDASDKIFYGVGTNLFATIPLFSLASPPLSRPSIYTGDGTLTGPRVVSFGAATNYLDFVGPARRFQVYDVTNFAVFSKTNDQYATALMRLTSGGKVAIGSAADQSRPSNSVWSLVNPSTLEGAFLPVTNLYQNDGTITSTRTVTIPDGRDLWISGTAPNYGGRFIVNNVGVSHIDGVTNDFFAPALFSITVGNTGKFNLKTPFYYLKQTNNVLTLKNVSTGEAEWEPLPVTTTPLTLYTGDGALTNVTSGTRLVTIGTNELRFDGSGGRFVVFNSDLTRLGGVTNWVIGLNEIIVNSAGTARIGIITTNVANRVAKVGDALLLKDTTNGWVDFGPAANLYNASGTLTGARSVNLGGNTNTSILDFVGPAARFQVYDVNYFGVYAQTNSQYSPQETVLGSPSRVKLITPSNGSTAANGKVLTVIDGANSLVDFRPAANIYDSDGTISSNRLVFGNSKELSFTNFSNWSVRNSANVTIGATTAFNVRAPNVDSAANGTVLTKMDSFGKAEWQPIPADTSIYKGDGTIPAGLRSIVMNGNITFNGAGNTNEYYQLYNVGKFAVFAHTNVFYSPGIGEFQVAAGKIKLGTGTSGGKPVGSALTLVDPASGHVDYTTIPTLYTADGAFSGNRTVYGGNNTLNFNGFRDFQLNPVTNIYINCQNSLGLFAKGSLVLGTPKILGIGGTATAGWVLTLQDAGTGRSEWAPAPAPPAGVNIYTSDGTLSGPRVLQSGGVANHLNFYGANASTGLPADYVHFWGWDRWISNVRTNEMHSQQNLYLNSPNKMTFRTARTIANGNAAMAGQVLTLAADGTADFQPVNTAGVDKSIYTHSDTLQADRTVTGAGRSLAFAGISTLTLEGTTAVNIKPPGVASATSGMVLTTDQNGTGRAIWSALPAVNNVYQNNGTLAGHRVITGNGMDFQVQNGRFSYIQGADCGIFVNSGSVGSLRLGTTRVMASGGSTAQQGWVLVLTNAGTGGVEFTPLIPPTDSNIYANNGTLGGARTVFGNGQNLSFTSINTFDLLGAATTVSGSTALYLKTKKQNAGQAVNGHVMTLQSDGSAEYAPFPGAVNFYNSNGTLTGPSPRVIEGGGIPIIYQNTPGFTVRSTADIELNATGYFYFKSPKMNAGNFEPGALYLKMINPTTGQCEFEPVAAPATLYSQNGSITDTVRSVSLVDSTRTLRFQGPGNVDFNSLTSFNSSSASTVIDATGNMTIRGATLSGSMAVNTPRALAISGGSTTISTTTGGTGAISIDSANGPVVITSAGGLVMNTPRGAAREEGSVLTYNKTTGYVEFQPATKSAGMIEYYGTGTTPGGSGDLTFTVGTSEPTFTGANLISGNYPDYTRCTFRASFTSGTQNATAGINVVLGTGNPSKPVRLWGSGSAAGPNPGDIRHGGMIELIYDRNQNTWVMLNFGIGVRTLDQLQAAIEEQRARVSVTVTNAVTAKVTTIAFAGVVDLFADLEDVPVGFKKVSTLGLSEINDGGADDFILATYNPDAIAPGVAIRSTVDPAKMWKRLSRIIK